MGDWFSWSLRPLENRFRGLRWTEAQYFRFLGPVPRDLGQRLWQFLSFFDHFGILSKIGPKICILCEVSQKWSKMGKADFREKSTFPDLVGNFSIFFEEKSKNRMQGMWLLHPGFSKSRFRANRASIFRVGWEVWLLDSMRLDGARWESGAEVAARIIISCDFPGGKFVPSGIF